MCRHTFFASSCLWVSVLTWASAPGILAAQPNAAVSPGEQPAVLVVQLPAHAELELVGEKTTQTGASRRFKTPALTLGREYDYPIKATWSENGQLRTVERVLKIRGGSEQVVNLHRPEGWPAYRWELSGYEQVRIENPKSTRVVVALRTQNGGGKEFVVEPGQFVQVAVPSARYDIYFQFADDPEGLYQGDSFTLQPSHFVTIRLMAVADGNYGIRRKNSGFSPFPFTPIAPEPIPVPAPVPFPTTFKL